MTDHFIARLIARTTATTGKGSSISIRPAITPDILPETFYLPDQRLVHSTSADYRKLPISSSTDAGEAAAAPTEQRSSSRRRDVFDVVNAKNVETGKSYTNNFKGGTTDTSSSSTTDSKIEKNFSAAPPFSSEAKDGIELTESKKSAKRAKKPGMNGVHEDINISGFKPQENSAKRTGPEDLRGPPPPGTAVVMPREPAELRHEEGLFAAYSKAHHFLQTGEKIEALHSEPEVTIKIGRIDVRAVMPEKPTSKTQQFPPLSLKEYLRQRAEGRL